MPESFGYLLLAAVVVAIITCVVLSMALREIVESACRWVSKKRPEDNGEE